MYGVTVREVGRRLTPDEASKLVGTTVPEPDWSTPTAADRSPLLIEQPTILTVDGEPIAAYLRLENAAMLRRAALTIDCRGGVQRNTTYRSRSRTFGYAPPRVVTRRESCSLTQLGRDQPDVEKVLEHYADHFAEMLDMISPDILPRDRATLGGVLPDWRLGDSGLWTSGVVNDTAALPYHRDGFNFATWSAMPVLRRGIRGGYLHLPEFGVALACADASVILFPGRLWVHGVTPIRRVADDGYRISIVYYALRGMKDCRTAAEETRRAQTKRTEREAAMAKRIAAGDMGIPGKPEGVSDALDRLRDDGRPSPPPSARWRGDRQAFAGWRNTGMGDRPWNSEAPRA